MKNGCFHEQNVLYHSSELFIWIIKWMKKVDLQCSSEKCFKQIQIKRHEWFIHSRNYYGTKVFIVNSNKSTRKQIKKANSNKWLTCNHSYSFTSFCKVCCFSGLLLVVWILYIGYMRLNPYMILLNFFEIASICELFYPFLCSNLHTWQVSSLLETDLHIKLRLQYVLKTQTFVHF